MRFYDKLQQADKEKLVEEAYHQELQDALKRNGNRVISLQIENNTDGVLETEYYDYEEEKAHIFKIIVETKFSESFSLAITRAKVLLQVICYLKTQEDLGKTLPHIIFVGDKDECFTLHTRYLQHYIQKDIVGVNSPSTAYQKNLLLLKEMSEDVELQEQCFIYEIDEDFDMLNVVKKMLALVQNIKLVVPVTEKSISKIFDYFSMRILKRNAKGETKYTPRMQVELFMELLLNPNDCILHTKKKNTAIFNKNHVQVNSDAFRSFTNFYEFNYNMDDQKKFTAICDRLIEDSDRRRKGDFYTPTLWVDEAHKMLTENLGENWKDEYIVFDCACGTKNLTRDYKFKRLYSSTLEEHDLVISQKYNKQEGANWAFQYDFLNDDVEFFERLREKKESGQPLTEQDFEGSILYYKAPGLVRGMLSGQKVLFFINPPYGTAGNADRKGNKGGIAKTKINEIMRNEKMGGASNQLYTQFLYRILLLKELKLLNEVVIALFSPSGFITYSTYKSFREKYFKKFKYKDGMTFKASNFADVSDTWGILFSIWVGGKQEVNYIRTRVKDVNIDIYEKGFKNIYNLDGKKTANDWVKEEVEGIKRIDRPQMTSGIRIRNKGVGKDIEGSLGYLNSHKNSVQGNRSNTGLYTSCYSSNDGGVPIVESNFSKCISLFTSKKAIDWDWLSERDEYMIPNVEHELYKQWENDCIVYSLFNTSSNQSSLRGIDYNGKKWNIYNHFFFMSRQEMLDLAQGKLKGEVDRNYINNAVEEDIMEHGKEERFVYNKLQEVTLSPDAQAVLDKARELVIKSFPLREMFNQEHPEYHINTWDAGYYQLVGLLKEYMPEDLKAFRKQYKGFEDRMRPLVYELGFLYK